MAETAADPELVIPDPAADLNRSRSDMAYSISEA